MISGDSHDSESRIRLRMRDVPSYERAAPLNSSHVTVDARNRQMEYLHVPVDDVRVRDGTVYMMRQPTENIAPPHFNGKYDIRFWEHDPMPRTVVQSQLESRENPAEFRKYLSELHLSLAPEMQSVHDRLKRAKKAWNDECELRGRVLVESNQQCHQNEDSSVDINSSSDGNVSRQIQTEISGEIVPAIWLSNLSILSDQAQNLGYKLVPMKSSKKIVGVHKTHVEKQSQSNSIPPSTSNSTSSSKVTQQSSSSMPSSSHSVSSKSKFGSSRSLSRQQRRPSMSSVSSQSTSGSRKKKSSDISQKSSRSTSDSVVSHNTSSSSHLSVNRSRREHEKPRIESDARKGRKLNRIVSDSKKDSVFVSSFSSHQSSDSLRPMNSKSELNHNVHEWRLADSHSLTNNQRSDINLSRAVTDATLDTISYLDQSARSDTIQNGKRSVRVPRVSAYDPDLPSLEDRSQIASRGYSRPFEDHFQEDESLLFDPEVGIDGWEEKSSSRRPQTPPDVKTAFEDQMKKTKQLLQDREIGWSFRSSPTSAAPPQESSRISSSRSSLMGRSSTVDLDIKGSFERLEEFQRMLRSSEANLREQEKNFLLQTRFIQDEWKRENEDLLNVSNLSDVLQDTLEDVDVDDSHVDSTIMNDGRSRTKAGEIFHSDSSSSAPSLPLIIEESSDRQFPSQDVSSSLDQLERLERELSKERYSLTKRPLVSASDSSATLQRRNGSDHLKNDMDTFFAFRSNGSKVGINSRESISNDQEEMDVNSHNHPDLLNHSSGIGKSFSQTHRSSPSRRNDEERISPVSFAVSPNSLLSPNSPKRIR